MTFYDYIELTDQEKELALLEARKRKYFHTNSYEYWEQQQRKAFEDEETAKELAKQPSP